jgi:hypothetical protein
LPVSDRDSASKLVGQIKIVRYADHRRARGGNVGKGLDDLLPRDLIKGSRWFISE